MSKTKVQLINNEFYHVILRGVGDTVIFKDVQDYFRSIFSIYEFNNANAVSILRRREERKAEKIKEAVRGLTPYGPYGSGPYLDKRDKFVEVVAFCFMPNHIHLLVKQLKENGISDFMQKVGGGYATYFNRKYKRKGHLFNNFKPVHIKYDNQLKNVLTYIHANPIALIEPGFKEKGVKNPEKTKKFLENYKWSSYQDYLGIKNFHYVTEREFIMEIINGLDGCRSEIDNYIMHKKDLSEFYNLLE